jgi:cytochrome c-type biogenesis protein CcmH/NrfG
MAATILIAGALLAQAATAIVTVEGGADRVDVGYEELRDGRPDAAIEQIKGNKALEAGDPAALINLGTAYARLGRKADAHAAYATAILSNERYDLQLADGRWFDSRDAARLAIHYLEDNRTLALR